MNELHKEVAASAAENRYNTLFHVLRREYTKKGRPLKGTFELTPHCTLDCKMCYVHAPSGNYPGRVMTGDEWIHIIDAAVDAGMLYAVLTGGECMVHPDFRRVYTHLKERGVFTAILSNGTLLDEEMVSFLRSSPPRFIRISVYGSCPEVYERVTGCGRAFHAVDRALNLLHEAGIVTDISVTVSRYNYEDFENLLSYVQSKPHANLLIDCDMQEPRSETGRKLATFALDIKEQEQVWRTYFNHVTGDTPAALCGEDFDVPAMEESNLPEEAAAIRHGLPCVAGKCGFFVTYSGDMQPCIQFPLARKNVSEAGFESAWRAINQAAEAYVRSEECRSCQYFGQCMFCPGVYSLCSGGENGLPGEAPCNKRLRMLRPIMQKKTGGTTQ